MIHLLPIVGLSLPIPIPVGSVNSLCPVSICSIVVLPHVEVVV